MVLSLALACGGPTDQELDESPAATRIEDTSPSEGLRERLDAETDPLMRHATRKKALAEAAEAAMESAEGRGQYEALRRQLTTDPQVRADALAVLEAKGSSYSPGREVRQ